MRLLFATGREHLPDRVDGAIWSAHALLEAMRSRGHECEAIAGIRAGMNARSIVYRARRLLTGRRRDGWADLAAGYSTSRMWSNLIPKAVVRRGLAWGADLVFTQLEDSEAIAAATTAAGLPVLIYVHDVEFNWLHHGVPATPLLAFIVPSHFVADRVQARLGVSPTVLPPLIIDDWYRVAKRRPRFITFINPVVEKGVEIALAVAQRLPHRQFLFVESWPLFPRQRTLLESRLHGLRNVRRRRPTLDMRQVYRETALLLMPSQWEEGFGRVALEAQVSGIPVIASAIGGIPEAVAGGGAVLLPPDAPAELWAEAVEGVLCVPGEAERLGAAGLANLARPELDPQRIVNCFEALAASHSRRCKA